MINYMTYNELYTQIGSYIQDTSASRKTQIKDAINREYAKIVEDIKFPQLLRFYTTTLPNDPVFYLARDVGSIVLISDTDRNINLEGSDTHQLYRSFADQIGGGATPVEIGDDGDHGKKANFHTAAETLDVVSSDAGDTTQTVRVYGEDSSGREQNELITLTGTSAVTTTLTYGDFHYITSNDKTRDGIVTVTGTTSSIEYADLLPNEVTIRYKRLRISGNSSNNIIVFYDKRVQRLKNDEDVPELPISTYLFEATVAKMYQLQRKWEPARYHLAEADKLKLDILATVESHSQNNRQSAPSRYGSLNSGAVIVVNPGS
jgi:hypothetical protein